MARRALTHGLLATLLGVTMLVGTPAPAIAVHTACRVVVTDLGPTLKIVYLVTSSARDRAYRVEDRRRRRPRVPAPPAHERRRTVPRPGRRRRRARPRDGRSAAPATCRRATCASRGCWRRPPEPGRSPGPRRRANVAACPTTRSCEVDGREVKVTNPGKVFFPDADGGPGHEARPGPLLDRGRRRRARRLRRAARDPAPVPERRRGRRLLPEAAARRGPRSGSGRRRSRSRAGGPRRCR